MALFMLGVPLTTSTIARCLCIHYTTARRSIDLLKASGFVKPTFHHAPPRFTNGRPAISYTLAV